MEITKCSWCLGWLQVLTCLSADHGGVLNEYVEMRLCDVSVKMPLTSDAWTLQCGSLL